MVLPPPWHAYMRLQSSLDNTTEVNNRSWGLEAVLDAIVAEPGASPSSTPTLELATTIATAERRERHRARLRRTYSRALWPVVDQPAAIEARVAIAQIRRRLPPADWQLISSVAMGVDYQSIGHGSATPGSLRVRVLRIREGLRLAA